MISKLPLLMITSIGTWFSSDLVLSPLGRCCAALIVTSKPAIYSKAIFFGKRTDGYLSNTPSSRPLTDTFSRPISLDICSIVFAALTFIFNSTFALDFIWFNATLDASIFAHATLVANFVEEIRLSVRVLAAFWYASATDLNCGILSYIFSIYDNQPGLDSSIISFCILIAISAISTAA